MFLLEIFNVFMSILKVRQFDLIRFVYIEIFVNNGHINNLAILHFEYFKAVFLRAPEVLCFNGICKFYNYCIGMLDFCM